jgi:acetolactate synthase-like protein
LSRADYHGIAGSLGARGLPIRDKDGIEPVLEEAVKASRNGTPVLINAFIGKTDFRKGSISM